MPMLLKSRALSRPIACAMMSLALVGCVRWEPQDLSPAQVLSEMKPARILVTRSDSSRVRLGRPQIAGDSVVGSVPGRRMSIPLSEVTGISVQKSNPLGTVALVLGFLAAAGLALVAIAMSGNYE